MFPIFPLLLCAAIIKWASAGTCESSSAIITRDGLTTDIPGWSGMSYYAARWEPLCGSIGTAPDLYYSTYGEGGCVPALNAYTNDTTSTFSLYDEAGVKLVGTGVGMGKSLCMCFSMSTSNGSPYDICWYYGSDGTRCYYAFPIGSFRQGIGKKLPHCGDVNVASIQAGWSQTAVMPSATGPVQTLNQVTTVTERITERVTLTPSIINMTIPSASVYVGNDGQLTTEDQTYTTTAAVIAYEPQHQKGLSQDSKIALGVGISFGLAGLIVAILVKWWPGSSMRARRDARGHY